MGSNKTTDGMNFSEIEDLIHNFLIIMLEHSMRQKDGWKVSFLHKNKHNLFLGMMYNFSGHTFHVGTYLLGFYFNIFMVNYFSQKKQSLFIMVCVRGAQKKVTELGFSVIFFLCVPS